MAPRITSVANILPGRIDWKIRVRIIHLWKMPAFNNPTETNTLEMVLLDEKTGKIHATIKRNLIPRFEALLEEGCAYVIENLLVAPSDPKLKTCKHKYKLNLMGSTKCTRNDGQNIPLHHFDFLGFPDILQGKDEGLLIDVIGHVVQKDIIKETNKNGKKSKLIDIVLEDLESNRLICTLWEDFADQMYQHLNNDDSTELIIVILQCCKLKTFNGVIGISNAYHGTKLLVNGNVEQVSKYKERLQSGGIPHSQVVSSMSGQGSISLADDLLQTTMMTISDLMEVTENCVCSILAKVIEVNTDNGWYYQSCTKCFKKVDPADSKFYCGTCDRMGFAIPRFKLQVKVIDKTGSTTFTLFDRVVSQLLGKSARDLIDMINKESESAYTPPEFESLLDKNLLFKVEVCQSKLNKNWLSYLVKKLSDDPDLLEQFSTLHGIKECAGDNETDLNNCLSPQLDDNIKVVVEDGDSNMKFDLSQEIQNNSTEYFLDAQEDTPSSKSSGKRSAEDINRSSMIDDTGTQTSSTKMPKIVAVKKEKSD